MCVKQFFGYSCGHCSIPTLIQCPLAASNAFYPTCGFPAERPIYTGTYCHPCFRVVWNIKVLKEEEEHRGRHLRGECFCEVRFEGEDREERLRERSANVSGEGTRDGQDSVPQDAEVNAVAQIDRADNSDLAFVQQQWLPHGRAQENDYLGYYNQQQGLHMADSNQSYTIAVGAHNNLHGQLMMGEVGSGMRWYPHPPLLPHLNRPRHKTPRGQKPAVGKSRNSHPGLPDPERVPGGQGAELSEPSPAGGDSEPPQPMVVSSGIAGLDST
jgi:hypothetical protein